MEQQQFPYSKQDFVPGLCRDSCSVTSSSSSSSSSSMPQQSSRFDRALKTGWTDRMSRGLFRYQLGNLKTRVLPGAQGYVAQLNIQRGTERRKPQEILSIQQPFSHKSFNFNKINPEEIIFEMVRKPERNNGHSHADDEEGEPFTRMVVLVNVSPLEFGHCLLVPEPSRRLPQILTSFAIQTGIESVFLSSDSGYRVGFNSLGAFASVNHLHLHGYYLDYVLQVECMPLKPLVPERGFYSLKDFPAGFSFYTEAEDVEKVAKAICQVTDFLVESNTAHNLFFTRGCPPCVGPGERGFSSRTGVRIVVWPRKSCFGAKEESAFNVALCELAGHLPFKNKQDYDHVTEKDVKAIIQRYLLPDEEFLKLEQQLTACLLDSIVTS